LAKGRYQQAFDLFTDCLLYEQNFVKAHISRAAAVKHLPGKMTNEQRNNWMWCDYSQAVLKTTQAPKYNYYTLRAITLTHLGRFDEAMSDLNKSIELNTKSSHSLYNRAIIFSDHTTPPNYEAALDDLDKSVSITENHLRGRQQRKSILATQQHLSKTAPAGLGGQHPKSPESPRVRSESNIFGGFERLHKSKKDNADEMVDLNFMFKLKLHRGDVLRKLGRLENALDDLQDCVSINVDSQTAWHYMGLVHCDMKKYLEADKSLTNAIDFEENSQFFFDRARVNLLLFLESKRKHEGFTLATDDGDSPDLQENGEETSKVDEATAAKMEEAKLVAERAEEDHHTHHKLKGHENDNDEQPITESVDGEKLNEEGGSANVKHSHDDTFVENAIEDYTNAIILQQELEVVIKNNIKIAFKNNEEEEACKLEEELVDVVVEMAKFLDGRSKSYVALSSPQSISNAFEDIEASIKLDPSKEEYVHQCGVVLVEKDGVEAASEMFKRALNINHRYAPSLYWLGKCLAMKMEHEEAIEKFKSALSCGLQSSELHENKGMSEFNLRFFEDAERSFQRAIELEEAGGALPAPEIVYYLGECRRLEHKFELANEDFKKVARYRYNSGAENVLVKTSFFRFSVGKVKYKLGDLEGALEDLSAAVDLDPHNVSYISSRAEVLANLGHHDLAEQMLDQGVNISKKKEDSGRTWYLLKQLAHSLFEQKKYTQASETYHMSLLESDNVEQLELANLFYSRGVCLAHIKRFKRAAEMFSKALASPKHEKGEIKKGGERGREGERERGEKKWRNDNNSTTL